MAAKVRQRWFWVATLAMVPLIVGGRLVFGDRLAPAPTQQPPPGKGAEPKPLDDKVVKAWEAAGARVERLEMIPPSEGVAAAFMWPTGPT